MVTHYLLRQNYNKNCYVKIIIKIVAQNCDQEENLSQFIR